MLWETVIGIEVHAQLKTKSKLFSGSSTAFGATANSQTSFIDAGLPGVLPVLNQEALVMAIQLGLAINADINDRSVFERKNYFYPDLPKGYQISQYQRPLVCNGFLDISLKDGSKKRVTIARAHLEEDAGKSLHHRHEQYTAIDLNRAGTPLLEIVTTPCLSSAEEAIAYLKILHRLLRFLGICDGNMQEGSFRCDVNLSVKPKGVDCLGPRTELKNLNSFRFIEKAIIYESVRHQELLEKKQTPLQETRFYHPESNTTIAMRSKENEKEYRYFPDPDLLPIQVTRYQIAAIKSKLPELPEAIENSLIQNTELNSSDIHFLLSSPALYHFYKDIKAQSQAKEQLIVNWLKGPYAAALKDQGLTFESAPVPAKTMAQLLDKVQSKVLNNSQARRLFASLWLKSEDLEDLIQRENAPQDDLLALEKQVDELIQRYPEQAAEYRAGKDKLLAFFVGQIMKHHRSRADAERVSILVNTRLRG